MSTPYRSVAQRASDHARQTGRDVREIYVELLALVNVHSPELIDAAFAKLSEWDAADRHPDLPAASVSCAKAKM